MKRQVRIEEISDGKLYTINDMVKAGCGDCKGCSACCRGMGSSIVLDPLDVHRIVTHLEKSFEQLIEEEKIELQVVDGIILPNLKMCGKEESCAFLNAEGRCDIHAFRPGICRLFPLGRLYEEQGFRYFLQVHECQNANRTKVKVRKWIDTPEVSKYERFVSKWHDFLKAAEEKVEKAIDEAEVKKINMTILQRFFMMPFVAVSLGMTPLASTSSVLSEDFYEQFERRLGEADI